MEKTFLICHPGALGDFILTWPALIALRKILPNHRFVTIGRAEYMRLAVRFGLLDDFVDGESRESIGFFSGASLPKGMEHPDGAVIFLKEGNAIRDRIQQTASQPVVLIDPIPDKPVHLAQWYIESIQKFYPVETPKKLSDGFPEHQPMGRTVFIHPGSGSETKNHSPAWYKKVAAFLKHSGWNKIWMVMGPAEIERGIPQQYPEEKLIFPKDAGGLADYLMNASLYIGNDSGVSHLAGYLSIPSIVLYKSTDPKVWGVVGKKVRHLFAQDEEDAFRKLRGMIENWN